ncbi:hypothetical protein TNCV_1000871 [Trichonephila clavipes]|nr:hypothetical protein TNCV_1000871 [Trichonephila clavipes]
MSIGLLCIAGHMSSACHARHESVTLTTRLLWPRCHCKTQPTVLKTIDHLNDTIYVIKFKPNIFLSSGNKEKLLRARSGEQGRCGKVSKLYSFDSSTAPCDK